MLMNKSLPIIRYGRRHPLLACHVSGFLRLAAAQKIIIGRGRTTPKQDIIPWTRQEHLGGRPTLRLLLELFRKSPWCGGTCAACSFRSYSPETECERRGDKYEKIMHPKTRFSSKRPALSFSFFLLLHSPITRVGIR